MRLLLLLTSLVVAVPVLAQSVPPAPQVPAGCATPESHQFDFWVGKWEVRPNGASKVVAHSLIEKKYAGCAIRENWMPIGKERTGGGGSLSHYDARLKKWRQAWVDSSGARADFDGGFSDGLMTITGTWSDFNGPGKDALVRMKYKPLADGQVRQSGEASVDGGRSWQPAFDFIYRRVEQLPDF